MKIHHDADGTYVIPSECEGVHNFDENGVRLVNFMLYFQGKMLSGYAAEYGREYEMDEFDFFHACGEALSKGTELRCTWTKKVLSDRIRLYRDIFGLFTMKGEQEREDLRKVIRVALFLRDHLDEPSSGGNDDPELFIRHVWKHDMGQGSSEIISIKSDHEKITLFPLAPADGGPNEFTLLTEWIVEASIAAPSGPGLHNGKASFELTVHPRFGRRFQSLENLSASDCRKLSAGCGISISGGGTALSKAAGWFRSVGLTKGLTKLFRHGRGVRKP